ncbi:radical SAM family heme chaperone HemW [Vermiphilus pyriformis]|jgi:oxygen-independent coproporphyrinogen-3 oxidase|nr:MAG: radical SAM family heme chaperone HemW [Vermiphilus pyriformis]
MNNQFDPKVNPPALYIHWPFCPYKCNFCPFVAIAGHDAYMEQYHNALCAEIEEFFKSRNASADIKTIFIGGGTPSTYPEHLLEDLFIRMGSYITNVPDIEISLEVNPGTVNLEKLHTWKRIGINRLSIGVQSINQDVLHKLGRFQNTSDVMWLLEHASSLFDRISIDLILGLPGIEPEAWYGTIEKVVAWPIKHISIYFLTIHENTPLFFHVKKGLVDIPADIQVTQLYGWTIERLERAGFKQYELSNFARSGYECQHNQMYWDRQPYKGFGIGACSFDGKKRMSNQKNLIKYINACQSAHIESTNIDFCEILTESQEYVETLMLGMRRAQGVPYEYIQQNAPGISRDVMDNRIKKLCDLYFITIDNNIVRLTPKGLMVENQVILELIKDIE